MSAGLPEPFRGWGLAAGDSAAGDLAAGDLAAGDLIDQPQGLIAAEIVLALGLLVVLALVSVAVRRRILQRSYGTIDCSLRLRRRSIGRGWVLGVGRFKGDLLQWYRVFSLAPRPRRVLSRRDLVITGQREPHGPENLALLKGAVVLECRSEGRVVELAMDPAAVPGFMAWLEARPPGSMLPR